MLKEQEQGVVFFIIKMIFHEYLRAKRGQIYWCFVDFRKAFDSVGREKWKTGVSENLTNCVTTVHQDIKFCLRCRESRVCSFTL